MFSENVLSVSNYTAMHSNYVWGALQSNPELLSNDN